MPWIAEVKKDTILKDSHVFIKEKDLYNVKKCPDIKPWIVIAWKVGTDKTFHSFYITDEYARKVFNPPFWREPSNAMDSKE